MRAAAIRVERLEDGENLFSAGPHAELHDRGGVAIAAPVGAGDGV